MPQQRPNQLARVLAIGALVAGFFLFVITIATSGGGSDGDGNGDDDEPTKASGPTVKGERAIAAGVWVVGEGDTLVSISEDTGIDLDELVELNPEIDPQALIAGQRVSLRAGGADETPDDGDGDGVDAGDTPAPSGSGVGDEGPSGVPDTSSDGIGSN